MDLFSLSWWGSIIGGVGIFLFGITFLGDGLKKLAGSRLKKMIDKFTSSPIKGIFVGFAVTGLIQSSSATTVIAIGLIRAGLMTLPQAVGIIMGANIGTTVTAFIIGLNISSIAPFILAIGVLIYLFASSPRLKHTGEVFFGFGALFFGLSLLETALKPLAQLPEFIAFVKDLGNNPFLGVLVGMTGTAVIQSSSAFIGIIQSLYSASASSGFTLAIAMPILFGSNIGTTITAVLASIGGSTTSKQAAGVHVMFNVLGSLIFLALLSPYTYLITWLSSLLQLDPKMQIAFAHILFNIITTLLLFPFTNILVKIVTKITPDKDNNLLMPEINLSQLDRNVMEISPATALGIAKEQTIVMGKLAQQSVEKLYEYFTKKDYSARDISVKIEATIDEFDRKLMQFLYSMEHSQLEQNEINVYSRILKTFKDIERISDHCENLVEYFNEFFSSGENIHEEAKEDILSMLTLASEMVKNSINSFEYKNTFLANIVREKEIDMDELNKQARERHVKRIVNNKDSGKKYISVVFVDLISNIERIGDHCVNIADTTLESIKIND